MLKDDLYYAEQVPPEQFGQAPLLAHIKAASSGLSVFLQVPPHSGDMLFSFSLREPNPPLIDLISR